MTVYCKMPAGHDFDTSPNWLKRTVADLLPIPIQPSYNRTFRSYL